MVEGPDMYPWSSFRCNSMGQEDDLVTQHALYNSLGQNVIQRQGAYLGLFSASIDDSEMESIRESTNKGWVLGNDRFKDQVSDLLGRRVEPRTRGGDRKSKAYKRINRL